MSGLVIKEDWMAIDIIQRKHGDPLSGICGVWCLKSDGLVETIRGSAVILPQGLWDAV